MLIALFVLLLALITIGVPILLVMGIVGLSGILIEPGLVPALFPQKMFAMLDNFSLLALPYFILAGELVSAGGISKRLVEFAEAVVGHWRAGLAHASVVSSMVFAGVSGSSVEWRFSEETGIPQGEVWPQNLSNHVDQAWCSNIV